MKVTEEMVEAGRPIIDRLDHYEAEWDRTFPDNEGILVTAGEIRRLKAALSLPDTAGEVERQFSTGEIFVIEPMMKPHAEAAQIICGHDYIFHRLNENEQAVFHSFVREVLATTLDRSASSPDASEPAREGPAK